MGVIQLDTVTHDRLRLVAGALGKTEADTVAHLLDRLAGAAQQLPPPPPAPQPDENVVALHTVYKGERVEATFDRSTQAVTITSGRLAGTTYDKPSPAARAVVALVDPRVNPHRNGWEFWIVSATGQTLQSIRRGR